MRLRRTIGCACAMAVLAALGAAGSAPAATKWLCGPGVANDPCRPSLSTTLYRGWSERVGRVTPKRDRDRGVDCFYVYPTVSNQQTRLATKRVDPELRSIALYQAARYSQVCRVYAPVYRQATVPGAAGRDDDEGRLPEGLRRRGGGLRRVPAPHRSAIARSSLIGHSQGTYHLQRLIRRRIDGNAALRRRLVSAVLLGGNVTVRKGSDRGGVFRHVPTCRRATQLSCVLAFSTFNETPPADAIFGRGASRIADFLGLPERVRARDRVHQPGRARQRPLRRVDVGRADEAVRARDADRRGDLGARASVAERVDDVHAERGRVHRRAARATAARTC